MNILATALKRHIISSLGATVIQVSATPPEVLLSFGLPSGYNEEVEGDASVLTVSVTPQALFHEFVPIVDDFVRRLGGRTDQSGASGQYQIVISIGHVQGLRTVLVRKSFLCYHIAILNTG